MSTDGVKPQAQAPGCFASPSVFSIDSKVCNACMAFEACRIAAHATLESIRGTINVADILARHAKARLKVITEAAALEASRLNLPKPVEQPKPIRKAVKRNTPQEIVIFDVSQEHERIISGMAIKTGELARQQIKQNRLDDIRPSLRKGINPYAQSGPKFLRLACDLLLRGGFTRSSLNKAMVVEFGWQQTTAGPHVAQVCGLFGGFGITQEINNNFTQMPECA